MRWIPARCRPARGEADGLWRWRLLSGPLRLGWPVPPRAAAARAIGPGSIRTARRSPWPAPGRPPSRPGSAATRGTRAPRRTRPQSPLQARSDLAAAREPLARPGAGDLRAPSRPLRTTRRGTANGPSSPVLRAPDRPAKRPTLRQARLPPEPAASEPRPVRKAAADAREGAGKREAERTASSARAQRRASRAVAVNTRPEWAGAVAPARLVSVCLYYVVCF